VRASWPFSLHQIRANTSHCSSEGKEALAAAFLWCTDDKHPVNKPEFARRVGFNDITIWKIYSGKYVDPTSGRQYDVPQKLVDNIRSFLELEKERFLGGKTEFVKTPTSKRIWHGCDIARESRSPVFVWGPSQIGKTMALEHYAHSNNHGRTVYVRMTAASGLGGMVRRIAQKVGVSPNSNTANLREYIHNALTEDMVLILDEVHLLVYTYRVASYFACAEVIREIYDEARCGMVLCGTRLLENSMKAKELEQIFRRGVHRISLPDAPSTADLTAILMASGLEFPDRQQTVDARIGKKTVSEKPYEVLRQLAKHEGLKAITERLRYAKKLANRADQALTWEHVIEAHLMIAAESTSKDGWE
jgi:DNA transposition AAA+ family ATPase